MPAKRRRRPAARKSAIAPPQAYESQSLGANPAPAVHGCGGEGARDFNHRPGTRKFRPAYSTPSRPFIHSASSVSSRATCSISSAASSR